MVPYDTTMNVYLISVFSIAVIAAALSIGVATTEVVRHRRLGLNRSAASFGEFGSRCGPREDVLEDLHGSACHRGVLIHHAISRPEHGEGAVLGLDGGEDRGRAQQRHLRFPSGARETSSRVLSSARWSQGGDIDG